MMRDGYPICPRCKQGLDRYGQRLGCARCRGALITEIELQALIVEAAQLAGDQVGDLSPAWEDSCPGTLGCPLCQTRMTQHTLHGMTVDRCVGHGIWFDGEELQHVLHAAGLEHVKAVNKLSREHKIAVGFGIAGYIAYALLRLTVG